MLKRKYFWSDNNFIRAMLAVALPVAIQHLISTSINMADTVMISSLGGAEIAAVGLVNQFVFFFIVASFGVSSAGAVFFSQYFGDDDLDNVRRYLSITLQITVVIGIVFTIISLLFPYPIMRILSPEQDVIELGVDYLRLIALTFVITGISQSFNTVLRSCNRANEIVKISITSLFTNVFFNYIFIFGKFGAPAFGVKGAAIGTVIARFVEVILLVIIVYRNSDRKLSLSPIELNLFHKERMKRFMKIAIPIILAEALWSLGQLLFAIAYARIGKDATASIQLTNTIQNVFFIIVNAISGACAVLIGQSLGANRKEYAEKQATYFLQITTILGGISLAILMLLPDVLMLIYTDLEPHIYDTARNLLLIRGLFIPFRFINGMIYVGIFRAGGETKIPFIIEFITMWLFAIPMAFIGVLVLNLSIEWIFTIVSLEEFIKMFIIYPLYKKKRWLNNITE